MRRDFFRESLANYVLRGLRAVRVRVRGRLYASLGLFANRSGRSFSCGVSPKFMNSKGILLGRQVSFGDLCRIECYAGAASSNENEPKIVIGDRCNFGDFVHLGAVNGISIGENLLCASKVLIIDHNHGRGGADLGHYEGVHPSSRELVSKNRIIIGKNVWIGESAVILGGADIGDGAVVGANCIVRGAVPAYSVVSAK